MLSNTMDTPALRHFAHEEHILTDATLYVHYTYYNSTVSFYVSEGGPMKSTFAKTAEHIDAIVALLDEENAHNLDLDAMSAQWKNFLSVANNGAVSVFALIGEVPASKCEICETYHFGELNMVYVPAFPEVGLAEASLRLEWKRGCANVRVVAGALDGVRNEALAMVDEILEVAMGEKKKEIAEIRSLIAES